VVRRLLAAVALALLTAGTVLIQSLQWMGFIALFVGGCLWWTALYLSRAAWEAARTADVGK
jgi:hypothetical protein